LSYDVTLPAGNTLVAPPLSEQVADLVDASDGIGAGERQHPHVGAGRISVEVAAGATLAAIWPDWRDLIERADAPNVFMNPELVRLAGESYPETHCQALLAWQEFGGAPRLVGIWAFAVGRATRSLIPVRVLTAPPMAHAYLATPVIDRGVLDDTLDAMLQRIADDRALPKIVALEAMAGDGATMQALLRVLADRSSAPCLLRESSRPLLASDLGGKQYLEKALSSSSRKKLRQHRRRLAERGLLESSIVTEPVAVREALDEFLQIEASGWKGRQHTALLSHHADAAFARAMISALAVRGDAAIHALYLDRKPVSMQIVLRAGPAAFTWKTAYDEKLHDVSPGMLLLEDYTAAFLSDDSIKFVDSCAFDDSGFMATWTERQRMVSLWLDARRGGSVAFSILSRLQKGYLTLRAAAKTAYLASARK
jgi:CelD/BcsL family acetyltransferase involved in cellulose biosynthesis